MPSETSQLMSSKWEGRVYPPPSPITLHPTTPALEHAIKDGAVLADVEHLELVRVLVHAVRGDPGQELHVVLAVELRKLGGIGLAGALQAGQGRARTRVQGSGYTARTRVQGTGRGW